jgi:hypothetical protein
MLLGDAVDSSLCLTWNVEMLDGNLAHSPTAGSGQISRHAKMR